MRALFLRNARNLNGLKKQRLLRKLHSTTFTKRMHRAKSRNSKSSLKLTCRVPPKLSNSRSKNCRQRISAWLSSTHQRVQSTKAMLRWPRQTAMQSSSDSTSVLLRKQNFLRIRKRLKSANTTSSTNVLKKSRRLWKACSSRIRRKSLQAPSKSAEHSKYQKSAQSPAVWLPTVLSNAR